MNFIDPEYLFFLFVVIISLEIVHRKQYQHWILLCASYFFYWYTSQALILLLAIITLITYYCGQEIYLSTDLKKRKILLLIAVSSTLAILGYFKYFNFTIVTVNNILNISYPLSDILLPIGISFYTFQALSYVFDIYRETLAPSESLKEYALFVSFFPQLVAGPIVRASELLPQLKESISITHQNLQLGITLILWGAFKKVVISDNISPIVNATLSNPIGHSSFDIISATFLFGIQIYCDFSGYTDIAIGTARIMGINLPINFLRPYLSQNPTDFWRRWHITLGRYIMDYLYIPLGGNRKGKLRTDINLLCTMLVCGLWHGAAWNYVIWGGFHGVMLLVDKSIRKIFFNHANADRAHNLKNPKIIISILITQYFVFLGWLLFRVGDLDNLMYCIKKYVMFDFDLTLSQKIIIVSLISVICIIIMGSVNQKISSFFEDVITQDWFERIGSCRLICWVAYVVVIGVALYTLSPNQSEQFIYFQF